MRRPTLWIAGRTSSAEAGKTTELEPVRREMMRKTKLASAGENVIDPKFFNFVAQVAHFFATYGIVLTFGKFWHWTGIAVAAPLCLAYAAVHEFWYDPRYENPVTRGSDLEDFLFLVAGVAAAVVAYAI
jgi:hypothetical protein